MATRTIHTVVDDLDGSTDNVTTRRFTLDGLTSEINRSAANSNRLDEAVTPYPRAARRLPRTPYPATQPPHR